MSDDIYIPRAIDETEEVVVKVVDGAAPSHVGNAFCTECFKETIHLLSNDYTKTLCRECGTRRMARKVGQNGAS